MVIGRVRRATPGSLPVIARCLMAMRVMHSLTMKLCPMFSRVFASRRERPVIALTIVEAVIHVAVEVIWSVIPGPGANE